MMTRPGAVAFVCALLTLLAVPAVAAELSVVAAERTDDAGAHVVVGGDELPEHVVASADGSSVRAPLMPFSADDLAVAVVVDTAAPVPEVRAHLAEALQFLLALPAAELSVLGAGGGSAELGDLPSALQQLADLVPTGESELSSAVERATAAVAGALRPVVVVLSTEEVEPPAGASVVTAGGEDARARLRELAQTLQNEAVARFEPPGGAAQVTLATPEGTVIATLDLSPSGGGAEVSSEGAGQGSAPAEPDDPVAGSVVDGEPAESGGGDAIWTVLVVVVLAAVIVGVVVVTRRRGLAATSAGGAPTPAADPSASEPSSHDPPAGSASESSAHVSAAETPHPPERRVPETLAPQPPAERDQVLEGLVAEEQLAATRNLASSEPVPSAEERVAATEPGGGVTAPVMPSADEPAEVQRAAEKSEQVEVEPFAQHAATGGESVSLALSVHDEVGGDLAVLTSVARAGMEERAEQQRAWQRLGRPTRIAAGLFAAQPLALFLFGLLRRGYLEWYVGSLWGAAALTAAVAATALAVWSLWQVSQPPFERRPHPVNAIVVDVANVLDRAAVYVAAGTGVDAGLQRAVHAQGGRDSLASAAQRVAANASDSHAIRERAGRLRAAHDAVLETKAQQLRMRILQTYVLLVLPASVLLALGLL